MILTLLIAATASLAHPKDARPNFARPSRTVPSAFRGEWHNPAFGSIACGEMDSGSIRITARRFQSFESAGDVRAVTRVDANTVDIAIRLTHGGGTFGYTGRFQLSADQTRLTVSDPPLVGIAPRETTIYARCT